MSKFIPKTTTYYSDFHISVGVDDFSFEKDEKKKLAVMQRRAEELKRAIERHCDGAGYVTSLKFDSQKLCDHCGLGYEEDEDGPVCCTAAVKDYEAWLLEQNTAKAEGKS